MAVDYSCVKKACRKCVFTIYKLYHLQCASTHINTIVQKRSNALSTAFEIMYDTRHISKHTFYIVAGWASSQPTLAIRARIPLLWQSGSWMLWIQPVSLVQGRHCKVQACLPSAQHLSHSKGPYNNGTYQVMLHKIIFIKSLLSDVIFLLIVNSSRKPQSWATANGPG